MPQSGRRCEPTPPKRDRHESITRNPFADPPIEPGPEWRYDGHGRKLAIVGLSHLVGLGAPRGI